MRPFPISTASERRGSKFNRLRESRGHNLAARDLFVPHSLNRFNPAFCFCKSSEYDCSLLFLQRLWDSVWIDQSSARPSKCQLPSPTPCRCPMPLRCGSYCHWNLPTARLYQQTLSGRSPRDGDPPSLLGLAVVQCVAAASASLGLPIRLFSS